MTLYVLFVILVNRLMGDIIFLTKEKKSVFLFFFLSFLFCFFIFFLLPTQKKKNTGDKWWKIDDRKVTECAKFPFPRGSAPQMYETPYFLMYEAESFVGLHFFPFFLLCSPTLSHPFFPSSPLSPSNQLPPRRPRRKRKQNIPRTNKSIRRSPPESGENGERESRRKKVYPSKFSYEPTESFFEKTRV